MPHSPRAVSRGWRLLARSVPGAILTSLALGAVAPSRAHADPLFVDWASLLPTLGDEYQPNSANDCVAGRARCVDVTIAEMKRRFDPMAASCDHEAVFALAYLRTTQTYEWARNQPGYFADTPFVNHEDAVFAKYYFRARDAWAAGNLSAVPKVWQTAFRAADQRLVSGNGDLLLGMSAHVNRDLPFVLAAIGIVAPDGTTRKPDHDKVNQFLNAVLEPLVNELGARFDPAIPLASTPYGAGYTGIFQLLEAWREEAWRNAELLVNAPTPAERALVADQIEASAAATSESLFASYAFVPPLTSTAARDSYCAQHHADPNPTPYPFGAL